VEVGISKRPSLGKEVNRLGFFSLAFGSMIGVGWVTAMGSWLESAGPVGTMIAFIVGGILMLFIGLCYAEVTSMLPVAGGEVAYAYKAFGVGKSFLVGWFLAFGYLSVSAFEAVSVGKILSYLLPEIEKWRLYSIGGEPVYGSYIILAGFFTGIITWINYIGIKNAARFQVWLTLTFLVFCMIFIVAGSFSGKISNLIPLFTEDTTFGTISGIATVFVTVPFWFVGFDTIPQSAEEAKDSVSYRTLGLLILLAISGAIVFYLLLIFSTSLLGHRMEILSRELATAEAFRLALRKPWLVNLILLAALVGLLTSWNGFFLAGSRVLFALGRGKIISSALGKSHSIYRTPYLAVVLSGAITMAAAFLGRGAMLAFVNVGSLCIAAAFLGVSVSFLKLKTDHPHLNRPYKAPGGKLTGYIAFLGALFILFVMILPFSGASLQWPMEWAILSFVCISGGIFWYASKSSRLKTTEAQRSYLILENF